MKPRGARGAMNLKKLVILLMFTVSINIITQSEVMPMSFNTKQIFFSEVHGVVLDHGKPVNGAVIERSYKSNWRGDQSVDRTKSDVNGKFYMSSISRFSLLAALLPHQPAISQKILITVNNKIFEAWVLFKTNYDNNGELEGKSIDVICDLANEPDYQNRFFGIARIR